MKRDPNTVTGIWCRKANNFYYLDTGIHSSNMSTQRVIRSLTQRGLIEFDPTGRTRFGAEPYKIMSLADAKEKGYETVRFSINQPTEKKDDSKPPGFNAWK